jgi:O-antigen/teichoic acid export membrane protein
VARILGREAWGDYSTAYTFVLIAAAIAPVGLVGLLPRQIARDPHQTPAALINSTVIGFFASLITAVVMILITYQLDYLPHIESLILVGLLTVILPQTEATLFETLIQGLERMEWIVWVRLPSTIVRVVASILLLEMGFGINVLFYMLALYYLFNCLLYFFILRRKFSFSNLKIDFSQVRLLLIQAMPFFIVISTTETFKQIDRIFLSKLWDSDAVGIYATGSMYTQLLYMFAPALMAALFPGLARTFIRDKERFSYLVSWLFKLFALLMFPIMLFTIAFADPIIILVFGAEYGPSIPVMQLLALGIVPTFLSRMLYRAILASDNERYAVFVALIGIGVSLLLNILLIPRMGVLGASLASLGTVLVNFAQNFWYTTKILKLDYWQAVLKPGVCMALSIGTYFLLLSYDGLIAFLVATAVFGLSLWLTKTFGRVDLDNFSLVRSEGS